MPTRGDVFMALNTERAYQGSRAVEVGDDTEHQHSLEEWAIYIESYLAEMKQSLARVWRKDGLPNANELNILRKITAMGVAAMEQHGAPFREGFENFAKPFAYPAPVYKNPNCTINHPGSSCNVACGY